MKEYCVDLEIAKELKENGFSQEMSFYYNICGNKNGGYGLTCDLEYNYKAEKFFSAPTSDELLKELPEFITSYPAFFRFEIVKLNSNYIVSYNDLIDIKDKKLSNALAKMWLYLKKEGYIK